MNAHGGSPGVHLYVSTACLHGLCTTGMPGEGSRCRATCKFCGIGCLCGCHTGGVPDDLTLRTRITDAVMSVNIPYTYDDGDVPGAIVDAVLAALNTIPGGC